MDQQYTRAHPFLAEIKERTLLCKGASTKQTMHIVLDIKGSGIKYAVGDCVAILPPNDEVSVDLLLDRLNASGSETIHDKRTGESYAFRHYLVERCNIDDCPPKFLQELLVREPEASFKERLQILIADKARHADFVPLELLNLHPLVKITPQELCDLLKPMMPRFYSIASSMRAVGEEVHLTIALESWESNGQKRLGVCTDFLCRRALLNVPSVPLYLHPHKGFTIPEDHEVPMIMIGPGTGVAPYRGFLQERESRPGKNWLFFGEWHQEQHFFYEEYWRSLEEKGLLRLDTAFSRDQEQKVYVQDKMVEKGADLFFWLQQGAYLYVCGDAARMAKDVEAALQTIIMVHGDLSEQEAREYIKRLRAEKRYLRDVY